MNSTTLPVLEPRCALALCEVLESQRRSIASEMFMRLESPAQWTVAADVFVEEFVGRLIRAEADGDLAPFFDWVERIDESPVCPAHEVLIGLPSVISALTARSTLRRDRIVHAHVEEILNAVCAAINRRLPAAPESADELDEIDAFINLVMTALDRHDPLSAEHSRAVASWCSRLGRQLKFDAASATLFTRAGLVHDIGKLQVPLEILNAPRGLTDDEWIVMKSHAIKGDELARTKPFLADLIPAIRHHHERLNGSGYPDGLSGSSIPLIARVVAVADAFNAMIGRRPYRPPILPSVAIEELINSQESQFDPEIVRALIAIMH